MFAWDFYRSAEAMISRLAAKRVLRFLLKKKLGDYILGDIDLDQLDVQLRQGTAQLTDLALNVDFLNAMLGTAPVVIKEGSIASLLVRVPWGMKDWQIEVEELELVLAPNGFPRDSTAVDNLHMKVGHNAISVNPQKHEENRDEDSSYSASNNVHEGVKTVAKFVKKFLTSFHVRLKNLIIAFDPGSDAAGNHPELSRILVFRIADIEFGTCISEDKTDFSSGNILGISRLMNSVKFQGAMVEFLEIKNTDSKKENPSLLGRSFIELCADNSSPLVSTTKILGGPVGGFSGVLDLSIPWKNGCLDIPKLSAEIAVDPIHVLLLPSTIMWMVSLQRYLGGLMHDCTIPSTLTKESGFCSFHDNPKGEDPSLLSGEMITSAAEINRLDSASPILFQKSISDDLHPSPHVIQNWVPLPVDYTTNFEAEYDYEASIDQFFECFDVMRSSQASSGNSGIWNLACSVFTVITAASNLASDSQHIPPEQRNVEANLKVTVAAISVVLLFHGDSKQSSEAIRSEQAYDLCGTQYMSFISTGQTGFSANNEDFQSCMSSSEFICSEQSNEENLRRNDMHILNILCSKLTFAFQIFPQCTKFGAEVQHIKIVDHFVEGQAVGNNLLHCINDFTVQTHMVQQFQIRVQDALPPFCSVTKDEKTPDASDTANFHPVIPSADTSVHSVISKIFPLHESCRVTLFESFGNCSVEYFASYTNSGVKTISSASFSLKLPPFIFWLDIQLVNMLLSFFNQIESSIQTINSMKAPVYGAEEMGLSTDRDVKNEKQVSPFSSKDLQGNIIVSSARIILCLDLDKKHCSQVYHWDTYISIDIRGVSSDKVDIAKQNSNSCGRGVSNSDYMSICLYSGTIDVHLVSAASKSDYGSNLQPSVGCHYSSKRIISATHQPNNHHATVCLIWQKDPVIDLQMAWKVQNVVNSKNPRNGNNNLGSEQDVAFVRRAAEESETPLRQELIQSSSFLTHIRFSCVSANLSNNEYVKLHCIITKVLDSLRIEFDGNDVAGKRFQSDGTTTPGSNNQMSIFVEFNHVDLSMTLDVVEEASKLLQRELPGSWTSLRLEVGKFELLSVTNVGGIADASFFGVSHGEGDLWGSISSMNKEPSSSSASYMFLLISCKNSVLGRGDGVGGNATSSGSAGTSVMYFKNPQACCLFTSAVVRCGTIVAPGCRLDWFGTIVTFFRLPCSQEAGDFSEGKTLSGDLQYKTSFYIDLIDVALSYEPHITANGAPRIGDMNITNQNHVACIVAASSFGFCQIAEDIPNDNFNIRLHDLGLLICNTKDSNSDKRYDVEHLRKIGYVKIASDAAMSAIVRTNCDKDLWEVEFSGLNVKMDTCGDTTVGLVCLLCQLQQLFAPDIDDALVHLLSRWNSTQRAQEADKQSADVTECDMGIMDEVADGIIFHQSEKNIQSNHCDLQKEILNDKESVREPPEMNVTCSGNSILCSVSSAGLEQDILQDSSQPQCRDRICMPEIMEGYYVTDKLPREQISSASFLQEAPNIPANTSPQPVSEKNGWYSNNSLVIVENYLSITSDQHLEKQVIDQKDISVHSFPTGTCKPSGRIILKHSNVRWRMLGGLDWPDAERNSSQSSKSDGRDQNACLELHLIGLNLRHDMYPEGERMVSNLSLTLQDFSLCDYSLNAPWKMVLGYYHSKHHPRESSAKALKLDLESVRLNPAIPLEEYRLQLAILPVRLHLDQSQLDFLVSFFSSVSISESNGGHSLNQQLHSEDKSCDNAYIPNDALLPFFQKCDIWPIIMRIDYIPRYVNVAALRRGNYTELINLVSWKGIDLHLKHVHGVGIYGWGGICEAVGGEWLEDISKNQVHKFLKGLKPVSSLFSVGSGAAKLVSLPVKDYRKDRKLVKGIQRGAVSFIRSISIETVGLGVHLAGEVHDILLKTECALAGSPQLLSSSSEKRTSGIRSNQPKDVHQGMQQAYESLSDGIGRTASALVGNPLRTFQRGAGAGSAIASVIRAAPAAAVAPASSAARAVHCALLGVRNSLDPEHKKDSMEKYHGSSDY